MSQDLSPLQTQPFDLNGDVQLQKELQNIKISQDKYNLLIINQTIDENVLEDAKSELRFAQLRYSVLRELKAQNLQLDNSTNKIFWSTEDGICECCLTELINLDGTNPNWKVRTCGHVGCNDQNCPSNSNVNGLGRQYTATGGSTSCPMCRQIGRGIFQGGNTIKKARLSFIPLGRSLTCATSQNYTDDDDINNFIPQQVDIRVNIIPEDIDQQIQNDDINDVNDDDINDDDNDDEPIKGYLALINNADHPCTAVLATEVIDKNQTPISQGHIDVIDISGSMKSEIENIKKTLIYKIESMSNNNYYSLIVFDHFAYTIIAFEKATVENKIKWISLIKKIHECGSTSYTSAINELIILLNEINQISPSLFSRTRVLIMGDGAGDINLNIIPQLHDMNINLYGITIGNDVNVETIKTIIGQFSFDQGNYRHYDNNNLFDLITSMELLATSFIKDVKIIVKNATIDASNVILNQDGTSELIYKYHGPGVKRLRLTNTTIETKIMISYEDDIACECNFIQGDQVILTQFCSYRKIGADILECTTMEQIDNMIALITEEKFGEHTEMITKLANTKKQEIDPILYPNITTPIQYSQNYTQNTIASLSATRSITLGRARSGI
jgi:von Willebrand factor type A domain